MSAAAKSFWERPLVAALIPWAAFMSVDLEFESVADFADTLLEQYSLALVSGMVIGVASYFLEGWPKDFYRWLRWHLGQRRKKAWALA